MILDSETRTMCSEFSLQKKQLIQKISSDKMMRHLHEIAKYVRMSGSEEEIKALRYVKKTLRRYGFKVAEYRFYAYVGEPKTAELLILTPEMKKIKRVTAALASHNVLCGKPHRGCNLPLRFHAGPAYVVHLLSRYPKPYIRIRA
jgi:hypothetical protein